MKKVSRAIAVAATLVVCGLSAFGQAGAGSLNNRLVKAAGEGDTASVLRLLRQGAKINAVNSDGWTALENAVVEGKIEAVRLLLDKGAKIEVGGAMSYSPLTLAAEKGYVEIVKLLLDKGANIEARNGAGRCRRQRPNGGCQVVARPWRERRCQSHDGLYRGV